MLQSVGLSVVDVPIEVTLLRQSESWDSELQSSGHQAIDLSGPLSCLATRQLSTHVNVTVGGLYSIKLCLTGPALSVVSLMQAFVIVVVSVLYPSTQHVL